MHTAAWNGVEEMVQLLLEHGADVNSVDNKVWTTKQQLESLNYVILTLPFSLCEQGKKSIDVPFVRRMLEE